MKKSFLGKGFAFPFSVNEKGNIALSSEEENIKDSIKIILGTAKGERLMNPEFGCDIHKLVFHPNSPNTAALVNYYVTEALHKWEPRISDVIVDAQPDPERENVMNVRIIYKVIRTNAIDNLVYPFYLRREQDL